eukprot:TRINITY_DN11865_c0_g2_i1.p1 TRINITY_DN11865_c0_g2~~TRINITY_DN11865_c0_g2_i1.p1  ORF type:complete len:213 (-),score=56.46 TRINITY_DN11865_c0_g2_i1:365-1003(-)
MLFIMNERLKGPESFFWPYFKAIVDIQDLSDFGDDYIKEAEELQLAEYLNNREEDIMKYWKDFQVVGETYYSDKSRYSKEQVRHAWKVLQTRSFGYNVFPGTSVTPIVDFLNHGLEDKLVFALWPKKVELDMVKRSILSYKNESETKGMSDTIKNGDEHYEEMEDVAYSNYMEVSEPATTNLSGKAVPALESIWDTESSEIFLELRSQSDKP